MKKGMLALTVLSCALLVGAPACRHKREQAKSPPPSKQVEQPKKAAEKKQKAPKKKQPEEKKDKAAKPKKPKQPSMSKKK